MEKDTFTLVSDRHLGWDVDYSIHAIVVPKILEVPSHLVMVHVCKCQNVPESDRKAIVTWNTKVNYTIMLS